MLKEAAMSQKRHEKVCYGGSYLATQAAGFPWSFRKTKISAEDTGCFQCCFIFTSVRSSSSSLIVAGCSPQCELGLGSLLPSPPSLWNYREAMFGAKQIALILKRFKTKPQETRPTTCRRNVSGILKPPFKSAAKPPSFPSLARAVPLAGVTWPSERCRCSTGFIDYQQPAFDEAQLSKRLCLGAHNCGGSFQCSSYSLSWLPRAVPWRADADRSQHAEWGEEEAEPTSERSVRSS